MTAAAAGGLNRFHREKERRTHVEPPNGDKPHLPPPTLWPVGFAVGIAILLTGLIVGWHIVLLGAILTVAFGFLWVRDLAADVRGETPHVEPERRQVAAAPAPPSGPAPPAHEGEAAMPAMDDEEIERFPRSKFLEASTLGLGGVIGGLVTVPAVGLMVLPPFIGQEGDDVDVGAIEDFPEGQFVVTTFLQDPDQGEVSRRTAYIRYNGSLDGQPSFTIVSNRCVHLGCPVQPNGPLEEEAKEVEQIKVGNRSVPVQRIPTTPAGFGCPCHGGQYDTEGNRTAGPPVRALDRYEFTIKGGRLVLGKTYSVGEVSGEGKEARIKKFGATNPGIHVDGPESWLYPIEAPR